MIILILSVQYVQFVDHSILLQTTEYNNYMNIVYDLVLCLVPHSLQPQCVARVCEAGPVLADGASEYY